MQNNNYEIVNSSLHNSSKLFMSAVDQNNQLNEEIEKVFQPT